MLDAFFQGAKGGFITEQFTDAQIEAVKVLIGNIYTDLLQSSIYHHVQFINDLMNRMAYDKLLSEDLKSKLNEIGKQKKKMLFSLVK